MSLMTNDRIRGAARGTPAIALSHLIGPDAKDREFMYAVYEYAPRVFIDPAVVLSIASHETGRFEGVRWNRDRNPGGIGIVSDDTPQPFRIESATVAAMCLVSALNRLVVGTREENWQREIPKPARDWLDTVWKRHCEFAPRVERLADMMTRYLYPDGDVGFTWAEDQAWAAGVVRRGVELYPSLAGQSNDTENDVVFGRVPRPAILELIVDKGSSGNGHYALPSPRQIVGGVEHITAGHATIEWYASFVGPGGERYRDAFWDFTIDQAGRTAMFNDPWGYRSPWANGSTDGLQGDGPGFINRFGINAVNDRLYSTEHVILGREAWSDAMIQATIELDAFMFDGSGVRWDRFPLHQDYGVVTHFSHGEFTGKGGNTLDECAGYWFHTHVDVIQDGVRARMKRYQTGVESAPSIPPPGPVEPEKDLPGAWTVAKAAKAWGMLQMLRTDGKTVRRGFDAENGLSLAWLQRAVEEGLAKPPAAVRGFEFNYDGRGDKGASASFANGWLAVMPSRRAGWHWADQ